MELHHQRQTAQHLRHRHQASVIAPGRQLDLNVIAEGVETQEDLEFLKPRDCNEYQRLFCIRPVPVDELKLLLAAYHPSDVHPGHHRARLDRGVTPADARPHIPHKLRKRGGESPLWGTSLARRGKP